MVGTGYWAGVAYCHQAGPGPQPPGGTGHGKKHPVTAAAAAECWRRYQPHLASLAAPGAGGWYCHHSILTRCWSDGQYRAWVPAAG